MAEAKGSSIPASWEYLMGTLKHDRMGIYVRESDVMLADSETIESAINACIRYGEQKGYTLNPSHIWREARSGYKGSYVDQEALLDALEAAKRGQIDVLVITEIRAISRRGSGEVFVIYDILQKANVRLETITESFENSAIGRFILSTRAFIAEVERENTYMRTMRGRLDRIRKGNLPGDGKPGYGLKWVDTEKEPHAKKTLDHTVVYTDPNTGKAWTKVDVMRYFFYGVYNGISMHKLCQDLTAMGIPTPGNGKFWRASSVRRWLRNPEYKKVAIAYRQQKIDVKATRGKNAGKTIARIIDRPVEEQIPLPEDTILEALVETEVWDAVQEQLAINKEESIRNNSVEREDLGILRCGFAHCGICGKNLTVKHHNNYRKPEYNCTKKTGGEGLYHHHSTTMLVEKLDAIAWAQAIKVLKDPSIVRAKVDELRKQNQSKYSREEIEKTISDLNAQMRRLFKLAQGAEKDDTIDELTIIMKDLERQKVQMEALLYDADADAEERAEIEEEIAKFEKWANEVRPKLADPDYQPTYTEMRLAIRIIGIHITVLPEKGDFPYRIEVQVKPPKIVHLLEDDRKLLAEELLRGDEEPFEGDIVTPMVDRRRVRAAGYAPRDKSS